MSHGLRCAWKLDGSSFDCVCGADPAPAAPAKLRWSMLPVAALREVVKVMMAGAVKVGERADEQKWRTGDSVRHLDAAFRHLAQYAEGQNRDEESGLPTLAHAAARILFKLACDLATG